MEGTLKLSQLEACEAMRAYLQSRGALPAHGKVTNVGVDSGGYQSRELVQVEVEIGEPPVTPEPTRDAADAAKGEVRRG